MVNWCENYVRVYGDFVQLHRFIKDNVNIHNEKSFSPKIREPPHSEYDNFWRLEKEVPEWSKMEGKSSDEEMIVYHFVFDTPKSPAVFWAQDISELYPNLTFEFLYGEYNMNFSGVAFINNGEIIHEESNDYGLYYGTIDPSNNKLDGEDTWYDIFHKEKVE